MVNENKIMCQDCKAPTASECICDDLNFSGSLSPKASRWIKHHSAVELANVAACKQMLIDLALHAELQSFAHAALGIAMMNAVTGVKR